jgi:hypothetical protein
MSVRPEPVEGSPRSGWRSVMYTRIKIKTAGGSPAASHFFLLRQRKSNQKEGDPGLPPLRGTLDQPQASGAAQLDLAGRTPRAPLRDSNITSDLAEVFFQPSRMASCFISARLNLRSLAADRGGAQGKKIKIQSLKIWRATRCPPF